MKTMPNIKRELLKLFYILKGIVNGLNTQKNFALFFDWFYPEYFPLIGKSLTTFIHDDEMVLQKLAFSIFSGRRASLRNPSRVTSTKIGLSS